MNINLLLENNKSDVHFLIKHLSFTVKDIAILDNK